MVTNKPGNSEQKSEQDGVRPKPDLELEANNFRRLAQNLDFGVALMDNRAQYRFVNEPFQQLMDMTEEQLIGHGSDIIPDIMHPDEVAETGARVIEAVTTGRRTRIEFRYKREEDGEWRWAYQTAMPWLGPDGELLGVMIFVDDISDEHREKEKTKELHRQLLHSQKMEAVGTLAGGIAHDFNNLLTIIMLSAGHALDHTEHDDLAHKLLDKVMKASERARKLTLNLLSFARQTMPERKPIAADKIIADLVEILERSIPKKVKIETDIREDLPPLLADSNQVEQALLNLCNNACDAMPHGGVISITTRIDPDEPEFCLLTVADIGAGMTPEVRDRCFEPFFTTKPMGRNAGLGLSIAFGIVENHRGTIRVQSEPDAGARFDIRLPLATDDLVQRYAELESMEIVGGDETILLVDDEELIAEITARLLEIMGYKVFKATSGAEAIEIFEQNRDRIDLVLLDIIMPDMYGDKVFEEVRKLRPDIKVVVISGFSAKGTVENMDIQAFMQKPFPAAELYHRVRRVLDS